MYNNVSNILRYVTNSIMILGQMLVYHVIQCTSIKEKKYTNQNILPKLLFFVLNCSREYS